MDNPGRRDAQKKISLLGAGVIVLVTILVRSGATILTPVWIDALNNNSANKSNCDSPTSERHIDPFTILLIVNLLTTAVFGVIYVGTKIFCSSLITERETSYDKKEFAVVGFSETFGAMFLLLASSGCRTAPYLQALASNFSIPITFFLRFLILRKRPTCRKLLCALLVLVALVTVMLPSIFPQLTDNKEKREEGGATGVAGLLWPVCYFFGFVPMSIYSIMSEKVMKAQAGSGQEGRRGHGGAADVRGLNTAYVLFWCYLWALLSQLILFWMDIVPGFGMTDNIVDFGKAVWFNMKCFVGYEGCQGFINYVSVACALCVFFNRIIAFYFLRYLEGANLMQMILMVPTPLVFIFYTLFDENPLKWHPHAYLSTWLSIVALCIMIPAIYIYNTGSPEVDYNRTDRTDDDNDNDDGDERRPLLGNFDNPTMTYDINYSGTSSVGTQAGSLIDSGVQTSPPRGSPPNDDFPPQGQHFQTFRPGQPRQRTNPFLREHRSQSDALPPRREYADNQKSGAVGTSDGLHVQTQRRDNHADALVSSSWPLPEYSSQAAGEGSQTRDDSPRDNRSQSRGDSFSGNGSKTRGSSCQTTDFDLDNRGMTDHDQQQSKDVLGTPDRHDTRDNLMQFPRGESVENGHGPVWSASDFNIHGAEPNQEYDDQLNPFSSSPYVKLDVGSQPLIKFTDPGEPAEQEVEQPRPHVELDVGRQPMAMFIDPREPAVQEVEESRSRSRSRSPEAGQQASVASSPPAYTSLMMN